MASRPSGVCGALKAREGGSTPSSAPLPFLGVLPHLVRATDHLLALGKDADVSFPPTFLFAPGCFLWDAVPEKGWHARVGSSEAHPPRASCLTPGFVLGQPQLLRNF